MKTQTVTHFQLNTGHSPYFTIPKVLLWIIVILSIISSLGFVALVMVKAKSIGFMYIVVTVLAIIYYFIRVPMLKRRGVDLSEKMKKMPGFDEK